MANNKIHPIDRNTVYDIPAKVVKLGRNIRDGKWGTVSDVVVIVRRRLPDGEAQTQGFHLGVGDPATALMMLNVAKRDWMKG